jgi:predicted phosphoribosyltransferase
MKLAIMALLILVTTGVTALLQVESVSAASSATVTVTVQVLPPETPTQTQSQTAVMVEMQKAFLKISVFINETTLATTGTKNYLVGT